MYRGYLRVVAGNGLFSYLNYTKNIKSDRNATVTTKILILTEILQIPKRHTHILSLYTIKIYSFTGFKRKK